MASHLSSREFVTCTNLFSTLSVRGLKTSIKSDNFLPLTFSDTDLLLHVVSFLCLEGWAIKNKQLIEPKGVKNKGK